MNAPLNRRRVSLQGGLALGRLLKEFSWFGQSSKTDDDPHQLGWRFNDPGAWPLISARRLTSLSAEATAAFGAMYGAFGTTEPMLDQREGELIIGLEFLRRYQLILKDNLLVLDA